MARGYLPTAHVVGILRSGRSSPCDLVLIEAVNPVSPASTVVGG